MARKNYSCDFETTTKIDDCRVWAYGYMEIGNKKNFEIGNSLEKFMKFVEKSQGNLYFHNLKFDGSFIINYLLKNGFKYSDSGLEKTFKSVISNMGQWYMIDICYGYKGKRKLHTVIYDSLKKLPFPVKRIAKAFKLGMMKGDIDYHAERPIGHEITKEEYQYIKNDIEIIADALDIQFKQGLTKMTSGSDSLYGYKVSVSTKTFERMFPVLPLGVDDGIRKSYKGGFTWLNNIFAEKEIGEGIVFDVNSLYPSVMYNKELPYGEPLAFHGEYEEDENYPLYIQHLTCEFVLKKDKIPTIQIKGDDRFAFNEYLKSSEMEEVDLYLTSVDLELMKEHYELYNVKYINGWKFRSKKEMFKDFIDRWTFIKMTETGAIKELAKLMLNSLYGKFASNPDVTGKIPYLKEDGSLGFYKGEQEFKDPVYTAMGAFITAEARKITITSAQKCFDRVIYCDTDSLHLTGLEIPDAIKDIIDPNKLGYWDYEATFEKARYVRQKTYCQLLYAKVVEVEGEMKKVACEKGDATTRLLKVTCAGMPDRVKENVTWKNFRKGFTSTGKLVPKQVAGGVVLVDREFTMK